MDQALDVVDVAVADVKVVHNGSDVIRGAEIDAAPVAAFGRIISDFEVVDFPILLVEQVNRAPPGGSISIDNGFWAAAIAVYNDGVAGHAGAFGIQLSRPGAARSEQEAVAGLEHRGVDLGQRFPGR